MSLVGWALFWGEFIVLVMFLKCISWKIFSTLSSKNLFQVKKFWMYEGSIVSLELCSLMFWALLISMNDSRISFILSLNLVKNILSLYNSKGSLKREVALEFSNLLLSDQSLGISMIQETASAKNNFQRHFWGSLSVSEHKRVLPFFFFLNQHGHELLRARCSHDQSIPLSLAQSWPEAPTHHSQALPRVCDIPPGRKLCCSSPKPLAAFFLWTMGTIAEGYHCGLCHRNTSEPFVQPLSILFLF